MSKDKLRPELEIIAKFLYKELLDELIKRKHIAKGNLAHSLQVLVLDAVGGFNIQGQYVHYGRYVETGRKANVTAVPIAALIEWIRAKKLNITGKGERADAFAVQGAIKKHGIKPSKWQTDPLDENMPAVQDKIEVAAEKVLYLLIENMIQNTIKFLGND